MALSEAPATFIKFLLKDSTSVEHMQNSAANYGFTVDIQSGNTDQKDDLEEKLPIVTVTPISEASSFAQFFHGIVLSQEYTQLFDAVAQSEKGTQATQAEVPTQQVKPAELPTRKNIFRRQQGRPQLKPAA